jgi:peptide/nickel transport system substrate-binding protein
MPLSNFNIQGVGSGPYVIKNVKQNSSGIPEYYDLKPFDRFALGEPFIKNLRIRFYPSEELLIQGYKKGEINALGAISPESMQNLNARNANVLTSSLPRIFAVFFNQNQAKIFADKNIRLALDKAIDKQALVREVLKGYGNVIDGPVVSNIISTPVGYSSSTQSSIIDETLIGAARQILVKNGWKFNTTKKVWEKKAKNVTTTLSFSLATADSPELKNAATLVANTWKALGVDVTLRSYEIGDLNQNVIRPRKYDALLFGEIIGRDPDLFSFWHSSQRNDPGLNIALYTNIKVDKYLEQVRKTYDAAEQQQLYRRIITEIKNDAPAVFLYSPEFLYIMPTNIKGAVVTSIVTHSERFTQIYKWYIDTDHIWKMFLN